MQAVTCDLCHRPIREETLWTCRSAAKKRLEAWVPRGQNGANTILHVARHAIWSLKQQLYCASGAVL